MSDALDLPVEMRLALERELEDGERIVWSARPDPRRFRTMGCAIMLFGVPWTAFICFWISGVLWIGEAGDNAPGIFTVFRYVMVLFAIPFVVVGIGMLTAPYWIAHYTAHTIYAVTDRRVIIIAGGPFKSRTIQRFEPDRLREIERREYGELGNLIFSRVSYRDSDGDRRTREEGFMGIRDVKQVENLIRAMVAAHDAGA